MVSAVVTFRHPLPALSANQGQCPTIVAACRQSAVNEYGLPKRLVPASQPSRGEAPSSSSVSRRSRPAIMQRSDQVRVSPAARRSGSSVVCCPGPPAPGTGSVSAHPCWPDLCQKARRSLSWRFRRGSRRAAHLPKCQCAFSVDAQSRCWLRYYWRATALTAC